MVSDQRQEIGNPEDSPIDDPYETVPAQNSDVRTPIDLSIACFAVFLVCVLAFVACVVAFFATCDGFVIR